MGEVYEASVPATTALSELALATQIAGDEPFIRYTYGFALAAAG